jgi:hypothetical protein
VPRRDVQASFEANTTFDIRRLAIITFAWFELSCSFSLEQVYLLSVSNGAGMHRETI